MNKNIIKLIEKYNKTKKPGTRSIFYIKFYTNGGGGVYSNHESEPWMFDFTGKKDLIKKLTR